MKAFWNSFPFFRFLVPFIAGIIFAAEFSLPQHRFKLTLYIIIAFLIGLSLFFYLLNNKLRALINHRNNFIFGILLNLVVFLSGIFLTLVNIDCYKPYNISNFIKFDYSYIVKLTEEPVINNSNLKILARVIKAKSGSQYLKAQGNIIIYLKKDTFSSRLKYGDILYVHPVLKLIEAPVNPYQFDYRKHLSNKNIYIQCFLTHKDWVLIDNKANPIFELAYRIRNYLLEVYKQNNIKEDEFAVLSSLTLGYSKMLSYELMNLYSMAGIIHLLCVSGLHVGIVYLFFAFILRFLLFGKRKSIVKELILLLLIWSYAFITGLNPPIMRATIMFSFVCINKLMNRETNSLNSIMFSAFVLLLYNPLYIYNNGFVLSYFAVIGIFVYHSYFFNLFRQKNIIINKILSLVSVTLAAQIFIFPYLLYKFFYFPVYFILYNLILIPLATFIIYCSGLLLIINPFGLMNTYLADFINLLLSLMNNFTALVKILPYNIIINPINIYEVLLFYFLIITISLYLFIKSKKYLFLSLITLSFILISFAYKSIQQKKQVKLIVYSIRNHTAIDFIQGKRNVLLTDSFLINNTKAFSFNIQSNWRKLGLKKSQFIGISDSLNFNNSFLIVQNNFINFNNKTVLIINKKNDDKIMKLSNDCRLNADYIILTGNPNINIYKLHLIFKETLIIFDSSNNKEHIKKWLNDCRQYNITYYDVNNYGAFLVNL